MASQQQVGHVRYRMNNDESREYCKFCNQLFHNWCIPPLPQRGHGRLTAQEMKCWFQKLVHQIACENQMYESNHETYYPTWDDLSPKSFPAICRISDNHPHIKPLIVYDPHRILTEPLKNDIPESHDLLETTIAQQKIRNAKQWVQSCLEYHPDCRGPDMPLLPTRSLDLSGVASHGIVRLIESGGRKGRYVALSHCWGREMLLQTTTRTLQAMRDGIQVQKFPLTFAHAIQVCVSLDIQHLWIDSLCIVQDDKQDWERESKKMCELYENSFFSIAATGSEDCIGGLFIPQGISGPKLYNTPLSPKPIYIAMDWKDPQDTPPLHGRAWTLQEWILPRRVLSFEENEMQYVCEGGFSQASDWGRADWTMGPIQLRIRARNSWKSSSLELLYTEWLRLVVAYRSRSITYKSDLLPAIAGLATKFKKCLQDIYLAGIWYEDFARGLAWFTIDDCTTSKPVIHEKVEEMEAPSWSWVSMSEPCYFDNPEIGSISQSCVLHNALWGPEVEAGSSYIEIAGLIQPGRLIYCLDGFLHEDECAIQPLVETCQGAVRDCWIDGFIDSHPLNDLIGLDWKRKLNGLCGELNHASSENSPLSSKVNSLPESTNTTLRSLSPPNGSNNEALVYIFHIFSAYSEEVSRTGKPQGRRDFALVLGVAGYRMLEEPNHSFGVVGDSKWNSSTKHIVFQRVGFFEVIKHHELFWQNAWRETVVIR